MVEVQAQPIKDWTNEAVAVSIGSSGKGVGHARVHSGVVVHIGTDKLVKVCRTQDFGEVVSVGDLLDESSYDSPAFLVQPLVLPLRVHPGHLHGAAVVFAQPNRVHDGQGDLLVATGIPAEEAVVAVGTGHKLCCLLIDEREGGLFPWEVGPNEQTSPDELTESVADFLVGAVHHRAIDEGGDVVDLLAGRERARGVCGTRGEGPPQGEAVAFVLRSQTKRLVGFQHTNGLTDVSEDTPLAIGLQLRGEVKVVVQELAPLHEDVREGEFLWLFVQDDSGADEARARVGRGEGASRYQVKKPTLHGSTQTAHPVLVLGWYQAREAGPRRPKQWVFKVITSSIRCSVREDCADVAVWFLAGVLAPTLLPHPCDLLLSQQCPGGVKQFTGNGLGLFLSCLR